MIRCSKSTLYASPYLPRVWVAIESDRAVRTTATKVEHGAVRLAGPPLSQRGLAPISGPHPVRCPDPVASTVAAIGHFGAAQPAHRGDGIAFTAWPSGSAPLAR
jgi:hypothetical protein